MTSTTLPSTPPWYAIYQTLFKPVGRGNNEERDKIWVFPLTFDTFYLNQSFPFYIFPTFHFGSRIIIYLSIFLPLFKVDKMYLYVSLCTYPYVSLSRFFLIICTFEIEQVNADWLTLHLSSIECFIKVWPLFFDTVWLSQFNWVKFLVWTKIRTAIPDKIFKIG